jgi:hypothetical protein
MIDTIWDKLRLDVGRTEIMLGRNVFLQWGKLSLRSSIWGEKSWGVLVSGRTGFGAKRLTPHPHVSLLCFRPNRHSGDRGVCGGACPRLVVCCHSDRVLLSPVSPSPISRQEIDVAVRAARAGVAVALVVSAGDADALAFRVVTATGANVGAEPVDHATVVRYAHNVVHGKQRQQI